MRSVPLSDSADYTEISAWNEYLWIFFKSHKFDGNVINDNGIWVECFFLSRTYTMMECIVTHTNFLLFFFNRHSFEVSHQTVRYWKNKMNGDKRLRAGELLQRRTTFYWPTLPIHKIMLYGKASAIIILKPYHLNTFMYILMHPSAQHMQMRNNNRHTRIVLKTTVDRAREK